MNDPDFSDRTDLIITFDDEVLYQDELYIVCGWSAKGLDAGYYLQLVPKHIIECSLDYTVESSTYAKVREVTLVKRGKTFQSFIKELQDEHNDPI